MSLLNKLENLLSTNKYNVEIELCGEWAGKLAVFVENVNDPYEFYSVHLGLLGKENWQLGRDTSPFDGVYQSWGLGPLGLICWYGAPSLLKQIKYNVFDK